MSPNPRPSAAACPGCCRQSSSFGNPPPRPLAPRAPEAAVPVTGAAGRLLTPVVPPSAPLGPIVGPNRGPGCVSVINNSIIAPPPRSCCWGKMTAPALQPLRSGEGASPLCPSAMMEGGALAVGGVGGVGVALADGVLVLRVDGADRPAPLRRRAIRITGPPPRPGGTLRTYPPSTDAGHSLMWANETVRSGCPIGKTLRCCEPLGGGAVRIPRTPGPQTLDRTAPAARSPTPLRGGGVGRRTARATGGGGGTGRRVEMTFSRTRKDVLSKRSTNSSMPP